MQKHAKSCKNLQNHSVLVQNLAKPCKIMQKQLSLMQNHAKTLILDAENAKATVFDAKTP